jgi:O-antigen/teichoic acid export membrane protein
MYSYKLLIQRIGLVGAINLFASISGFFLLPILTKNLPIQDYGIWAQIVVSVGIAPGIVILGLDGAMARFLPSLKNEDIVDTFYSLLFVVLLSSFFAFLLIELLSKPISRLFFDSNLTIVKILAVIIFVDCLNKFFLAYFRATQQIKKYSTFSIVETFLNVLLVSAFIFLGKGINGAATGFLLSSVIILFINFCTFTITTGIKRPSFTNIKAHLHFGVPTIPGNLSKWAINFSDRYVISLLLGTAAVGYYSPGYSLGNLISMLYTPILFMLPMLLAKSYDEDNTKEVKKILSYSVKYLLAISIPAAFGISLLSKSILTILSTQDIASQSFLITPFIALSTVIFGMFEIIQQIIILEKKMKVISKLWSLTALSNLLLNFLAVPYLGIVGAAFTTLFSFVIGLIFTSWYSRKILAFHINFTFIFKSIFSSLIMSLLLLELHPVNLIDILITISICAISYILILFLLNGFEKTEIDFLKEACRFKF